MGKEFWIVPDLIKTNWVDGAFEGYRCPERGCTGVVGWKRREMRVTLLGVLPSSELSLCLSTLLTSYTGRVKTAMQARIDPDSSGIAMTTTFNQIGFATCRMAHGCEAAQYLKVKVRTLLLWVRQGKVKAFALSGTKRRVWRFRQRDLDAALLESSVLPSNPPSVRSERRIK